MHDTHDLLLPAFELPVPEALPAPPLAETPELRLLELRFPDVPLYPRQIARWRGAVAESAGLERDIFHNHRPEGDGVQHRPALIQYRSSKGCAVLWGMNAGADALGHWYAGAPERLCVDGRERSLERAELRRSRHALRMTGDRWRYYRLHDYLALNPANYRSWLDERRLIGRAALLENALTAHLLAFCQAAGWWLPARLEAELVELHRYQKVAYHGAELLAFELTYRCNLDLPEGIALGKAVSHGFGVQWKAPRFEP